MHDQTFLESTESPLVHKRHRKRRRFHAFWVTVVSVCAGWLILFSIALGQTAANTLDARQALERAQNAGQSLQLDSAKSELASARRSLVAASNGLVFVKTLGVIPFVRAYVHRLDRLLSSQIDVVDSLTQLLTIGQDLVQLSGLSENYVQSFAEHASPTSSYDELPLETKRLLLQRLSASAEDLELLATRIRVSREEFALLRLDLGFESLFRFMDDMSKQLAEVEVQLRTLTTLARILPEFAGLLQEKTHLLLLLNNDELRPGGGFIGTYGLLRMQDGEIRSLKTKDVYALDRRSQATMTIPPPEAMRVYNETQNLFLRDANWSPDFAVSALAVIGLFLEESANVPEADRGVIPTSSRVDGVIGMTPDFVSDLLSITGPITVSGQVFRSDTIAQMIEYEVERGFAENGIPYDQRKEILSELVSTLRLHILALPISEWDRVFRVVETSFREKQLFLYSANSQTEDVLTRVGWAGRVLPATSDLQLVVDANLASLKSDPEVKRTISYQISKNSTGQYLGRTTIRYRHEGSFDWRTTRYRTYTRLYVPKGTRFIRSQGSLANDKTKNATLAPGRVDISEDLDLTVFGAFISIEPGQTGELSFDYELAPNVVAAIQKGAYDLSVLKQNGARDYALTLSLNFGKKVADAVPSEDRKDWGNERYDLNTNLAQDRSFSVSLQ